MKSRADAKYCIDTCSFSNSWHRHYAPESFPSMWTHFELALKAGTFMAPEQVYEELQYQKDALSNWAKGLKGQWR